MGGLHHVEVNVSDLERSMAFWGWLLPALGDELYQLGDGRSWRCGDAYLVFVQADHRDPNYGLHRQGPRLNHLAFWAESAQQVADLAAMLAERGYKVLYTDRSADAIGAPSSYSVFFEDPDRIKVEVITPEEP